MDPEVQQLISANAPHLQPEIDGRVKCTLNGHVMPATLLAVKAFTSGAKFQRLKKKADEEAGFAKYEPFIIQSRNIPEKLYCALTCMLVNKSTDSLRKHMKGKAFLAAKGKFEADELELMEEPDFEESEASQSGEEMQEDGNASEGPEDMDVDIESAEDDEGPRGGNGAAEQDATQSSELSKAGRGGRMLKPAGKRKGGGQGRGSGGRKGPAVEPGNGAVAVSEVSGGAPAGGASKGSKRVRAKGSRPKKVERGP